MHSLIQNKHDINPKDSPESPLGPAGPGGPGDPAKNVPVMVLGAQLLEMH